MIDCGTYGLSALDALPHCGAVIPGDDEERINRLFSTLRGLVNERKERFGRLGVSTLSEYRRAGGEMSTPRVVVLLDGYATFAATFERVDQGRLVDELPRLVAEGRSLGIHFVITADRRGAVPGALSGVVTRRVVCRLANDEEYASLGIEPAVVRGAVMPPGRAFVDGTEIQIAVPGDGEAGDAQVGAVRALGALLHATYAGIAAPPVRTLPVRVTRTELPPEADAAMHPRIGIADRTLEPVAIDLTEGHFMVVGPLRSGRTSTLATIAAGLRASDPSFGLFLLAPRRGELAALDLWTAVGRGSRCDELAAEIERTVQERDPDAMDLPHVVVVIDDAQELEDSGAARSLESVARRGGDVNVHVVAAVEARAMHHVFGGWLSHLRRHKAGLLLDPDRDIDGELFGIRLPRQERRAFSPGRGYLIERGAVELVQVALS